MAVLLAALGEAKAEETKHVDKSQYTLFNRTPIFLMRKLMTDRPHTTENPSTVDAGHVQIESGLFGFARSRPDLEGTITEDFLVVDTNIRIGLTNSTEIDLILLPYGVVNTRPFDQSAAFRNAGVGRAQIRAKINLWGNAPTGSQAPPCSRCCLLSAFPPIGPTASAPPMSKAGWWGFSRSELSHMFALELNDGVLYLRDDIASTHHTEFLTTANLEAEWTENVVTYY